MMKYMRCKCGKSTCWTSIGMHDCQGCAKCNTTYSEHPDHHKPLMKHTPIKQFDRNTGELSHYQCSVCHERCDMEGYPA